MYQYIFGSSHVYATRDGYTLRLAKASIKKCQDKEEYKKAKNAFKALSSSVVTEIECDEVLPESIVCAISNYIINHDSPTAFICRGNVKALVYSKRDNKFYVKSVDASAIRPLGRSSESFFSTYIFLISSIRDMTIPYFSDSTDVDGCPYSVRCVVDKRVVRMTLLRLRMTPHFSPPVHGSCIQQHVVDGLSCHINFEEKKVIVIREEKDLYISPDALLHVYTYTIDCTNIPQSMQEQYKDEMRSLVQQVAQTRKITQIFLKIGLFLQCADRGERLVLSLQRPQVDFSSKIFASSSAMSAVSKTYYEPVYQVKYDPTSFITREMEIDLIDRAHKDGFASKVILATNDYILVTCRKSERGTFFVKAMPVQIHWSEKEIVLPLLHILSSTKNTLFETLYYESLTKGKISITIQYQGSLRTFTLAMLSETLLQASCCPFEVTVEHLLLAKVPYPASVSGAMSPLLLELYTRAISLVGTKKAGACVSTINGTFYVQLHVKKNSFITVGIGVYLGEEKPHTVEKMINITLPVVEISPQGVKNKNKVEIGPSVKTHVEIVSKTDTVSSLAEGKLTMGKFTSPHVQNMRKIFQKKILFKKPGINGWDEISRVGIQMAACACDSVERLVRYPPLTKKELLARLSIGYDAAKGLSFIHEYDKDIDLKTRKPIRYAHMNFKPEHLYISHKGGVSTGIVGIISPKPEGERVSSMSSYTSPETISHGYSSQANDVWSLGLTFVELAYGRAANPFASQEPLSFVTGHQRLMDFLEIRTPYSSINSVISQMLSYSAKDRPRLISILPLIERELLCLANLG